jgi:hypothetical protein
MTTEVAIVFDCADPERLARFWMAALPGYDFPSGPPEGYASWQEWADAHDIPEQQRNASRTIVDRAGGRPDIFFIRVPEPKTVKNRLHLDVRAGRGFPPDERRQRITAAGEQLSTAGASVLRTVDDAEGFWLVMQDPEGNEFCVI